MDTDPAAMSFERPVFALLCHAQQPVRPDFQARIVLVGRQEVTTKQAEFLVINVFSERVGMGVAQQAVIGGFKYEAQQR